uniref:Uncharacterized protein n=1 Tax=Dunaliella tertiolecta TaxID=3047 RepID=A0A7S3VS83_DUNTE
MKLSKGTLTSSKSFSRAAKSSRASLNSPSSMPSPTYLQQAIRGNSAFVTDARAHKPQSGMQTSRVCLYLGITGAPTLTACHWEAGCSRKPLNMDCQVFQGRTRTGTWADYCTDLSTEEAGLHAAQHSQAGILD